MSDVNYAENAARQLQLRDKRVVFAESCTAGLAAARLACVPGISQWHCGSAVTYREATKIAWLDVRQATLSQHTAVSKETTLEMAIGVLAKTPEADVSVAITGHLGPHAPEPLDGLVFIAVAMRNGSAIEIAQDWHFKLQSHSRVERQEEAARLTLECLAEWLAE
ncbi:MAG: nicotinamide-nucleotide amidase [Pirellulaceae bacterium]|jgi:nicotinamide-nucleotide amidase